ncbi:glycosyltransferase family 2 protein [Colwellia sp. RSH04]|uniref:glycosyltransferase family 2 protein n=1 Tax=Colwellia sp. RSH04 TaxID=2305464 RepID=UPI000E574622|nr:glycosyltransferase family 2 protein [Colwellia sp. RSH04]RHW75791.1 glycosyltransferase family 2 protein [Colwellia sp. RSH04]
MTSRHNACAVIPSYNHSAKLAAITELLLAKDLQVIIVDDASSEEHKNKLQQITNSHTDIELVRHKENQGKGGAVITGLLKAQQMGFTHALQVDADGQHDLDDMSALLEMSTACPQALISGQPIYDDSIPKGRLWGRSITHFWVHIETLSFQVKDTMCGFRIYPLSSSCALIKQIELGKRMDFDIEIMVRLFWRNVPVKFVKTKVDYPEDGQSHFRALHDNLLISWLHTRLVFGMLLRSPVMIVQRLHKNREANNDF